MDVVPFEKIRKGPGLDFEIPCDRIDRALFYASTVVTTGKDDFYASSTDRGCMERSTGRQVGCQEAQKFAGLV